MLRLRGKTEPVEVTPGLLLLEAFFKPFIGVIIAVFAYAALQSGIISSSMIASGENPVMRNGAHWVIPFICGFSERFALGLIGNVESRIDVSKPGEGDGK